MPDAEGPLNSEATAEMDRERRLPWYLPPVDGDTRAPVSSPRSISGVIGYTSLGGALRGSTTQIGFVWQFREWASIGAGLVDATLTLEDSSTGIVDVAASLVASRIDIGRYHGYYLAQLASQPRTRVHLLFPSLSATFGSNPVSDVRLLVMSAKVRLLGARVEMCPGIHIDFAFPVLGKSLGFATRDSMDPFGSATNYTATGSSFGFELEVGYTWWRLP